MRRGVAVGHAHERRGEAERLDDLARDDRAVALGVPGGEPDVLVEREAAHAATRRSAVAMRRAARRRSRAGVDPVARPSTASGFARMRPTMASGDEVARRVLVARRSRLRPCRLLGLAMARRPTHRAAPGSRAGDRARARGRSSEREERGCRRPLAAASARRPSIRRSPSAASPPPITTSSTSAVSTSTRTADGDAASEPLAQLERRAGRRRRRASNRSRTGSAVLRRPQRERSPTPDARVSRQPRWPHAAQRPGRVDGDVADLAGGAARAAPQCAAEHDARPRARCRG